MYISVPPASYPPTKAIRNHGFTLIELMVVVAIISILGMIALPQYQRFATKAKLSGALSELASGKAGVETFISEGWDMEDTSVPTPEKFGLPQTGEHCQSFEISRTSDTLDITCNIRPDRRLRRVHLSLERSTAPSGWKCRASLGIDETLLPESCRRF